MARFLSQANLSVAGQIIAFGQVVDLDPADPEVGRCVEARLLLSEAPGGGFAITIPAPRRCCGG